MTSYSHSGADGHGTELTFSDVGAIDLSMKKARRSSPPPVQSAPCPPVSAPLSAVTDTVSQQAMTDALCSLFALPQSAYGAAEQAALAQLIAGQQLAAPGSDLPLSLAAAAAATAGLFPPIFDGVSGLFYPPSLLAALAATAQGSTAATDTQSADKTLPSAAAGTTTQKRCRGGRRRGSRTGRNSSVFISSLFPQQSTSSAGDDAKSGRSRGTRGRQGRGGRGRQRAGSEQLAAMTYMDLDVSHS